MANLSVVDVITILTREERMMILGNDTFKDLYLRLIAVEDNPAANAILAFVAQDHLLPLTTATPYDVAVRMIEVQANDLLGVYAALLVEDGKISQETAEALGALLVQPVG
jgi:hypothetical protein